MTILILIISILVVMVILGNTFLPVMIMLVLLALFSAMCELFFVITGIVSLFTRKANAEYVRLENNDKYGKHAVYLIDGEECDNMFPTDSLMEKFLYKKKNTKVRRLRLKKRDIVIDRPSQVIIILGLTVFTSLTILFISFAMELMV